MRRKKLVTALIAVAACLTFTGVAAPSTVTTTAQAAGFTGVKKISATNYQYYKNGKKATSTTGIIKYKSNWWYIKKGKVALSYTGVAKSTSGKWIYVKKGKADFSYTGLAKNTSGKWLYVKKGKADFTYNGLVKNANGKWLVQNGKVTMKYNGAYMDKNGKGYIIVNSKVDTNQIADLDYLNAKQNTVQYFDYSKRIAALMDDYPVVPQAAKIGIAAADEKGASGVVLTAAKASEGDYYLNAYVAGNKITLTATGETKIASAVSSNENSNIALANGIVTFTPATIDADNPVDEIITVTMSDGTEYRVHTVNEMLPGMDITGAGVKDSDAGVYTFTLDHFFLRVNTKGELVYYRYIPQEEVTVDSRGAVCENMAENFAAQDAIDGSRYYTAFIELEPTYRNAMGGFSSGYYLVMDKNYVDIDQATLEANKDAKHYHGQGYLDQHEFLVLGKDHYINLSYTPILADNLPKTVKGLNGGNTAYVWVGIIQEVKNGKVIKEINTGDYPLLYDSAVESINYSESTLAGVATTAGQTAVENNFAAGVKDYVHVNSVDYTLDSKGNTDKILVSMRDQSAVYQFDFDTGAIEWILGGKASTLKGYEAYTTTRKDDNGVEFAALTFGQHFARYTNKDEKGQITGNTEISLFDNQTGIGPFLTSPTYPGAATTKTRTFEVNINEKKNTAKVCNVINGTDLTDQNGKYHIASHCGSVQYDNATSVTIGWGLHGVIDNIPATVPDAVRKGLDTNYPEISLKQGCRPVFTDYNMVTGTISFELTPVRNTLNMSTPDALFSYRTYKNAN